MVEIFGKVMEKLKGTIHLKDAAIYMYDPYLQTYCLKSRLGNEPANLQESITEKEIYNLTSSKDVKPHIIQLENNYKKIAFMYVAVEKACDAKTLYMIKKETEKLIQIVSRYTAAWKKKNNQKISADLALHLFSYIRKEDILNEATKLLKKSYPAFTFQLLLAQDIDTGLDFPVSTMDYSEDITLKCGLQAFMSGEATSETDERGNIVCLFAPLTGDQGVYGVFKVTAEKEMHILDPDGEFISKIAFITGKAMEKAILYETSNALVADLKLINDATHMLNSNLKLSDITKIVRNQVMDICHATQVGFILYNEHIHNSFEILQGSTAFFSTAKGKKFAEVLTSHKKCYNRAVFNSKIREDERFSYRSVMVIPMQHGSDIRGVIAIMHNENNYFSFDIFKLLQALIRHSTLALANALLTEKLEKAVITDYLTKLYSRNYLEEQIAIQRTGTLMLFDIDDFKVVNDKYGHHIGDQVLRKAAEIIQSYTGKMDIAARWGGEELALYAPHISINRGVQVSELILKDVKENTKPLITLSSGVSSWNHATDHSVSDLFIRTDKALYEAKNSGKNSVVKK